VAGINGSDEPITLNLAIPSELSKATSITVFADKEDQKWDISTLKKLPQTVKLLPRGGILFELGVRN
jgi:hypothetical protein